MSDIAGKGFEGYLRIEMKIRAKRRSDSAELPSVGEPDDDIHILRRARNSVEVRSESAHQHVGNAGRR